MAGKGKTPFLVFSHYDFKAVMFRASGQECVGEVLRVFEEVYVGDVS